MQLIPKNFIRLKKNNHEIRKKLNLEDVPVILFFGKLDYKPNYEAIEIIRNEILPRVLKKKPNTKFLIVGDNPPLEFKHQNIIFTGLVKKIEDYINASDFVICPLVSGGGTRIKILETLACGKPVISTTIGAEGIENEENSELLYLCDDWNDFAEKIILSLLNKKSKIHKDLFEFSWEKSESKIENIIGDM